MDRQKFLDEKLEFFVKDYKDRRDAVRRRAHGTKLALVLLGALTTITVGLREFTILADYGEWLGILALVLSASATTVAAWEGFANYSWRWVHSRQMLVHFYQLRDEVAFRRMDEDGLSEQEAQDYFDQMMNILQNANSQWSDKRGAALDG